MTDVVHLLTQYLTSQPADQIALRQAHPAVFSEEVVAELVDAETQMLQTDAAAKDINSTFSALVSELCLPGLSADAAGAFPNDCSLFAHHFGNRLKELLPLVWRGELPSTAWSAAVEPPAVAWHRTPSIVDAVFAFMTIEDILCVAENTSRLWRLHLCSDSAMPLWIGCVQREYPRRLAELVAAEGGGLLESDWRMVAMTVCSDDVEE
jgi:hypothetical protein